MDSVGTRSRFAATQTAPAAGTNARSGKARRPNLDTNGIAIRAATAWAARITITGGSFPCVERTTTCGRIRREAAGSRWSTGAWFL